MTAVIVTGGKQYKVREGDIIYTEKLPAGEGETVLFNQIIAVFDGDKIKFGNPTVAGVSVRGRVVKNGKNKKIVVFKMKAKKNYHRTQGHRQAYTKIQIELIEIAG